MFQRLDDVIVMEVNDQEAAFLGQIPSLLDSVGMVPGDRGYEVLHRPLCLDDEDMDAELRALVSPEMDAQRLADRESLTRCLRDRSGMTLDEAHGFLRSLNEARLVLAAREGAFDDGPTWEDRIEGTPGLAAVAWLGYVQGELIRALTAGM
jgi:hypothetical protein